MINYCNLPRKQIVLNDGNFLFLLKEYMVEHRAPARLPSDQSGPDSGCRLFLECTHLKLDLEIEPIFASLALYDLSARRKISENFYFDTNSKSMMAMLSQHISRMEISTLSQRCIVNITYPSPDIFIVVRVRYFPLRA